MADWEFGRLVKKRLIDKEMTQTELALALGCDRYYLNKILNGKKGGEKYKGIIREFLELETEK